MSVYKEFFHAVQYIKTQSQQIWNDACDYGAPTKKGDKIWTAMKMLADYAVDGTRKVERYETGTTVEVEVYGIDEWAVSDVRLSQKDAEVKFKMCYTTTQRGSFDGYVYLEQIK